MLQNKGKVVYENHYYNNIDNGGSRHDNGYTNVNQTINEEKGDIRAGYSMVREELPNNVEGRKMENLNEIITALGSAIAGVYCLVKTIINAIKKIKK